MNTQHPSYRPGTPAPADGSYYLKPANVDAVITVDTDGDVRVTTVSDNVLAWTHVFRKGENLSYLEGREPDPMWVLLETGLPA